ncbi:ABC transporter ATP-binding protein [Streptomyces bacillaris]|uniref:ABC transporter ATP-binding protein n=1 Tax=Streptomyces bacillaris TaxID=68179 RepID=UPI0035E0DAB2
MITLRGLTKLYGTTVAVDGLTLDVAEGRVTGFLGPNGAGKSTTMRMILGLDHPTSGEALIGGRPYASLRHPVRVVGALLDARALHPARSARSHLLAQAHSNGIPARRVDEVLDEVGLTTVARRRTGGFSLGMYQRLGIAGALLGDPEVLVLDEPVNGLDPDGVRWVRELVRAQADRGRTVLLSSHLMSEMQLTADQLVVIGRGRLLADSPMASLLAENSRPSVRVRVPHPEDRRALLTHLDGEREAGTAAGCTALDGAEPATGARTATSARTVDGAEIVVEGRTAEEVGDLAHRLGIRLHELRSVTASLEEAYMELTERSVEYAAPPVRAGHLRTTTTPDGV